MSEELRAAAERICKFWSCIEPSKPEHARMWHQHLTLDQAYDLARHFLSPPAPGPGLDAEGFVRKCREGAYDRSGEWFFDSLEEGLVAELRAALGTGEGDDGEPVTFEWLLSLGFKETNPVSKPGWYNLPPLDFYHLPPKWLTLDVRAFNCHGSWPKTRGDIRRLAAALGIPLPPAPNERNGDK